MEPSPKKPKLSEEDEGESSSYIPTAEDSEGVERVSVVFSLNEETGALCKALRAFNVRVY